MECNSILSWVFVIVKNVLLIINIICPILLMISLTVQFLTRMSNPDDKKGLTKIKNSIVALVLVFFIPFLLNLVLSWVDDTYRFSECIKNASYESADTEYIDINDTNDKKQSVLIDADEYDKAEITAGDPCGGTSKVEYVYESLKGGLAIPHYHQIDPRWHDYPILDWDNASNGYQTRPRSYTNLGAAGCDSTSFAMVATYLLKRTIYPTEVIERTNNDYTWRQSFGVASDTFGIARPTYTSNFNDVKNAVKNYQPVIAHYGGAPFTASGHFVVIRGINSDGTFLVNDPNDNSTETSLAGGKGKYVNRHFTEEEMTATFNWAAIFNRKVC